jgi:hypothetical protein
VIGKFPVSKRFPHLRASARRAGGQTAPLFANLSRPVRLFAIIGRARTFSLTESRIMRDYLYFRHPNGLLLLADFLVLQTEILCKKLQPFFCGGHLCFRTGRRVSKVIEFAG